MAGLEHMRLAPQRSVWNARRISGCAGTALVKKIADLRTTQAGLRINLASRQCVRRR